LYRSFVSIISIYMEWLNYHHLLYFWTVANAGSITAASRELRLTQPTVSTQVKALETSLGQPLFHREGRRLELTETGHVVFAYAEEIFSLGRELLDTVHRRVTDRPLRLRVGIADVIPKLVAERLLRPALGRPDPVHLICREDRAEALEAELGSYSLDLVLADAPLSPRVRVRAYSHSLGASPVGFFATGAHSRKLRTGFPRSLDGFPVLLPAEDNAVRRALDAWFDRRGIVPHVVGEFEDSALMKVCGQRDLGAFPSPLIISDEVCRQYRVRPIGVAEGVEEAFYAITPERHIDHPAVRTICEVARESLAAGPAGGS
jgi:LysR family transcriptional activator of nhaA